MNGPSNSLSGQPVGHKMKSDTENKMSAGQHWTNQQASFPVFTAVFLVDRPITALQKSTSFFANRAAMWAGSEAFPRFRLALRATQLLASSHHPDLLFA